MASVTAGERSADSVAMAELVFGKDFVDQNCVMTSLINANSPMVWDGVMLGALKVLARANQACVISPFIVAGAMSPTTTVGTLTQILAEASVGIAFTQLCRPGAPVVFGTFAASMSMQSGAPTFGTPEPAHVTFGAAQLARRMGVPFRSGGGLCGSKVPDAQAAYESSNTLWSTILSGVNYSLGKAFEALPLFDFWPFRYATSYELKPGCAPLPPDDPGFAACYEPVGDFPEVGLPLKSIYTRVLTAFGAGLAPIL